MRAGGATCRAVRDSVHERARSHVRSLIHRRRARHEDHMTADTDDRLIYVVQRWAREGGHAPLRGLPPLAPNEIFPECNWTFG